MLRRLIAGCCLIGFGCVSFHWEVRQVMMWQEMVTAEGPEVSWIEAADRALSGETPCSGCLELSREQVAGESDEAVGDAGCPPMDDVLIPEDSMWLEPSAYFSAFQRVVPHVQERLLPPPTVPPV